jgi:hypothetical protein
MKDAKNAEHRILLENLPKLLKGYGKTFNGYPKEHSAVVILVCDLDEKCPKAFLAELLDILNACRPKPKTEFCLAVEEGEAWFLGDLKAIKTAYPRAKDSILVTYINDSICGTWEKLADAIYTGGSQQLSKKGWLAIGTEKNKWATEIPPHMDITINMSQSFCSFRDRLIELSATTKCPNNVR